MSTLNKTLLKNGLKGLANLEENYFKENITHALALKLNESIDNTYRECSKKLLYQYDYTKESNELKEFVEFVEAFKPGKYEFKNYSVLNITESDMEAIKNLFEALGSENRQKMVAEIFTDPANFQTHIEFYNQSKGLI